MKNNYKKILLICVGALISLIVICISIRAFQLQQSDIRKQLQYSNFQYQRLLWMLGSDIINLEYETNFEMPIWEGHTPYRAVLADERVLYIVFSEDNSVAAILDKDYHLTIFGMIEQGRV